MEATCQWNMLAWGTQPGACLIRATSVAWRRWGNIKRTKYATAAGYTIRPGWLMLYLRALRCSDESLIVTPRSCAVSCLPFAPRSAHRTLRKTGKCCHNSAEADHPGAEYRPATVWMASEPSQSGGRGQCSHCKWWMEAATALGRALAQSIRRTVRLQCLPGKLFHSQAECASKIQFKGAGLRCVTSLHKATRSRQAASLLTAEWVKDTYGAASGPRRAENWKLIRHHDVVRNVYSRNRDAQLKFIELNHPSQLRQTLFVYY